MSKLEKEMEVQLSKEKAKMSEVKQAPPLLFSKTRTIKKSDSLDNKEEDKEQALDKEYRLFNSLLGTFQVGYKRPCAE